MRKTKTITLCAVLTTLALALSYTERLIPLQLLVPVPGIKLGLANIVTMTALYLLGARYSGMILLCRCVLGAVFGGGITGFLFSLWGGLLALGIMTLTKKWGVFSLYGVSILGAAAHNIGQILAAVVLLQSIYVGAYLPYLLLIGIVTGIMTGGATAGVLRILKNISIPGHSGKIRNQEDSK